MLSLEANQHESSDIRNKTDVCAAIREITSTWDEGARNRAVDGVESSVSTSERHVSGFGPDVRVLASEQGWARAFGGWGWFLG
jgi:hypothetical protein